MPVRPLKRLLIANRGEIARRVIRTARRMGIETVAVYSDADRHAPHVREADHAVHIGSSPARESYLDQAKVLAAAASSGADAVHPGYGFLSENAAFAEAVIAAGLIWVGPPASSIRAMGLKDAAKKLMAEAGVPTTPGYLGEDQSPERLEAEAARIGYPVLIKAVAGGGGKGMRKVEAAAEFAAALAGAKREAAASFGDDRVLLETYVTRPRHIEVQVFADRYGNAVHLYERDCSLQRRHQKVIEEAPAPGMDDVTRAAVTSAAVKAAQAVGYEGAGTVEFIADASEGLRADRIWFMEMNTRLQVEHPVTEMVTGQDLVEWQLRVAAGEPLPLKQDQIALSGWAMEARLYAENPSNKFLPSTGKLEHFILPRATGGVRVDSGVEEGGEVTPFYDPMIAKLIARAPTRREAARRLAEACAEVEVWPVKTNAGFLSCCAAHADFIAGDVDTSFIEARLDALTHPIDDDETPLVAALALSIQQASGVENFRAGWSPWDARFSPETAAGDIFGFQINKDRQVHVAIFSNEKVIEGRVRRVFERRHADPYYQIIFGDRQFKADVRADLEPQSVQVDGTRLGVKINDTEFVLFHRGDVFNFSSNQTRTFAGAIADGQLLSPMPGRIVSVGAEAGAKVAKGQAIVTLEAMKMEHALTAPFDGVLAELSAKAGDQVSEGVLLARIVKAD